MDVFQVRGQVIDDYREFTTAFVDIADRRIKEYVDNELQAGRQWPEPWISLNPTFEIGGRIDEPVVAGVLHPECERILIVKEDLNDPGATPITLHKHQREAVEVAQSKQSYVLTTGTGSGKSLAYMVPTLSGDTVFETAFVDFFGGEAPEELNGSHQMTIGAGRTDVATERIVRYLAETWGLPIDVVMFQYFTDGDRSYLARTFLIDAEDAAPPQLKSAAARGPKEPWNGRHWYVSFGLDSGHREWEDARRFGFVSAGGGAWYSNTLRGLPPDAHINVCIPGTGYVATGTVIGPAMRFGEATLEVDGTTCAMTALELCGDYVHAPSGSDPEDDSTAEWIVPVHWEHTVPVNEAVWRKGMFANQNSACKLRQSFTSSVLAEAFGIKPRSVDGPGGLGLAGVK